MESDKRKKERPEEMSSSLPTNNGTEPLCRSDCRTQKKKKKKNKQHSCEQQIFTKRGEKKISPV